MKNGSKTEVRTQKRKGIPERKIRLFLAVDLPQDIKKKVARQVAAGMDETVAKKVPAQNLHITVRFFGYREESSLPTLIRQIEEVLVGQEQFSLILGENGCFPGEEKPKILFTGVSGDVAKLSALAKTLAQLRLKAPREKFVPHITVALIKSGVSKFQRQTATRQFLLKQRKKPLWFPVTEIVLFQSKLSTSHPIYTKIATFALG